MGALWAKCLQSMMRPLADNSVGRDGSLCDSGPRDLLVLGHSGFRISSGAVWRSKFNYARNGPVGHPVRALHCRTHLQSH